jgi:methionyl-tRNA formyltransferase
MRVVFMGTPQFAADILENLCDHHEVCAVFTRPDAVSKRGSGTVASPVKRVAQARGIPAYTVESLRQAPAQELMASLEPEIVVVVAYGYILPREILDIPTYGCLNVHSSILPRWRGAAPVQRALLAGDTEVGVCIMRMEEGLDTGAMLSKRSTHIADKNGEQLHDELAVMGAELLVETLPKLEAGEIVPEKQDDALSTYAKMLSKKEGQIDFTKTPEEIERMIRAFDSWPGAYASYGDKVMKIWKASVKNDKNEAVPGTVTGVSKAGIEIAAGGSTLVAEIIQMPGKKRVAVAEFLKGNNVEIGTVLG